MSNKSAFSYKTVTQIAVIVRDIEKSAKAWGKLFGIEPPSWFITDKHDKALTNYKGEPTDGQAKLAFIDMDNLVIELIEPVGGPSTWQEYLDAHGEGVHHIAFQVVDMNTQIAILENLGFPLVQRGGKQENGWYSYIDSIPHLGVALELLEGY